jgi:predicted RNA binding protein YcfA (HicA-like mRNA interferase family)
VTGKALLRLLKSHGCRVVRHKGSHVRVDSPDGACHTTVPVHAGEDLGAGLLRQIERDMERCLGKGWLTR